MPTYPVTASPKLITGVNSDSYILKNSGSTTIYIGQDSSLTVASRAFSLTPGSVLQWPGRTSEIWAMTDPAKTGEIEILFNSQANFTPGPDHVTATIEGDVTVAGDVGIIGTVPITGDVGISGPVTVDGEVAIAGPVAVTGDVGIDGPVTVNGSVGVTGPVTVTGDVGIQGDVSIAGDVTVTNSVLNVGGTVTAKQDSVLLANLSYTTILAGADQLTPQIPVSDYASVLIQVTPLQSTNVFQTPANNNTFVEALWMTDTGGGTATLNIADHAETSLYNSEMTEVLTVKGDFLLIGLTNRSAVTLGYRIRVFGFTAALPESYRHIWGDFGQSKSNQNFTTLTLGQQMLGSFAIAVSTVASGVQAFIHVDSFSGDIFVPYMRSRAGAATTAQTITLFTGAFNDIQTAFRADSLALAAGVPLYMGGLTGYAPRAPLTMTVLWNGASGTTEVFGNIVFKGKNKEN